MARNAFMENTDILFALPLYVENVSGIMLEFLENLPPKGISEMICRISMHLEELMDSPVLIFYAFIHFPIHFWFV